MIKKIRIVLAVICFVAITVLFLDVTGNANDYLGWLAKLQFVPAILSLNLLALVFLILLALVFGRIYCSVICPLGVMQDVINWFRSKVGPKKSRKNRFGYSAPRTVIRIAVLVGFVALVALGFMSIAALIEPYSEYGRIASTFLAPIYDGGNNLLADMAQARDSYAFHHVTPAAVMVPSLIVAGVTLLIVGGMAWFGGRDYCNTICPVGTVLGYISKYSWLKPVIDVSKCNGCKKCARNCKAKCIDPDAHTIDYTRCVACMDCLNNCSTGAIKYTSRRYSVKSDDKSKSSEVDASRRKFLSMGTVMAGAALAKAEDKVTDGGFADILPKEKPARATRIVPPGALGISNLERHCTSCQLCIASCPNGVLRPSMSLSTFMQPEVSYENGYCRPECTECSSVCPTGAIIKIDKAEKSAIKIGNAVVDIDRCISAEGIDNCGNCARHCPTGAIEMVSKDANDKRSPKMPVVNSSLCIGCGACENLCPVRPLSAIHVEGIEIHHNV